jgi:hypothetical protein
MFIKVINGVIIVFILYSSGLGIIYMSEEHQSSNVTRRDFINAGAACATSLAVSETILANRADPSLEKKIRLLSNHT